MGRAGGFHMFQNSLGFTDKTQPSHLSRLEASDPAAVKVTASWFETAHVAPVKTNP